MIIMMNTNSTVIFNPNTSMYSVIFAGTTIETTVTDNAAIVDKWLQKILFTYAGKPTVVGLDIEWRPHRSPSMSNKSATLQLCINNKCLIIQLFYMDEIPQSLKGFLSNSNFTFVGVEVGDDIAKLRNEYGLVCSCSADVRVLAIQKWLVPGRIRRLGLKDLALELVNLRMKKPKHVCMSNWEARVLNENQVEYACIDAYASYALGHKLIMDN